MTTQINNVLQKPLLVLSSIILSVFFSFQGLAQPVSVSAKLDSTLMFIGGQMDFILNINQPANMVISIPVFNDSIIKSIEVVEIGKPDTTFQNNNLINILQKYRITSFDTGLHYIPPITIEYETNGLKEKQMSNSLALMVINPFNNVDPEKGLFDIKSPINTPFSLAELLRFLPWVVATMLLSSLLVLAIHWWLKRRNPLKDFLFKEKPKDLPHVIALKELERIKDEKIWQKGQTKLFYSQVTDTVRTYMERRYNFPAMEQTTPEILNSLKFIEIPDDKLLPKMKQILETADLAKFAKYEPLADENDFNLLSAFFFVNQTKQEVLKSPEEAAKESLQREVEKSVKN